MDYKLKTIQDLFYIYGVKLNQVYGYNRLEGGERAKEFVMNYYNNYGIERNISIIKVIKYDNHINVFIFFIEVKGFNAFLWNIKCKEWRKKVE